MRTCSDKYYVNKWLRLWGLVVIIAFSHYQILAQKFIAREASVTFFSEAPLEDIKAVNNQATSIFDVSTGEIVFSVPIREFQFKKSLMQQHFNEKFMESDKYPTSTFKGKVTGYSQQEGSYQAVASGALSIHGKTRTIQVEGQLLIKPDEISINAEFPVQLEDYDIEIPRILFSNIAESVDVTLDFIYHPYEAN